MRVCNFTLPLAAVLMLLSACSGEPLVPLEPGYLLSGRMGRAELNFCTDAPDPKATEVDYFFVTDMSGSNKVNCQTDPGGNCRQPNVPEPGTNPNGDMSFGAIDAFLANLQKIDPQSSQTKFALLEFSSQPTLVQDPMSNLPQFRKIIQHDWYLRNYGGWTDYENTVAMLQAQIQAIIDYEKQFLHPTQHIIQVIYTSDGRPAVLGPDATVVEQDQTTIVNMVKGIEAMVSENPKYLRSIAFNTVYYYVKTQDYSSYDAVAVQLLQKMSQVGYGQFYNATTGQIPDYSAFLVPKVSEPYRFTDLFVRDMNVAWAGPAFQQASDGLMPDSIRVEGGARRDVVGSGNPDSDDNGVSDLVEYTINDQHICNDLHCSPANATHYETTVCEGFLQSISPSGLPQYSHRIVPRGVFNDCELRLMNANLDGTDLLPGTGVPQDLAATMFYQIAVETPTTWLFASQFNDGFNSYLRIKNDINPLVSTRSLPNLRPYRYHLTFDNQTADLRDCYSARVDSISLSTLPADNVRVYLVETAVGSSTPRVRIGSKRMQIDDTVSFSDADLQ